MSAAAGAPVRWSLVIGATAAAIAAWLALAELSTPARLLTVFLVGFLPAIGYAQARTAAGIVGEVPRTALYASSAVALWLLALATFAVGVVSEFTLAQLGLHLPSWPELLVWSAAATAAALGVLATGRLLRVEEQPLLRFLLPRGRTERVAFAGVALSAGVCEELVFRGFLITALIAATGSTAFATGLSCAVFGMLHAYQGSLGVFRTGVVGLIMAVPFLLTGSVVPSMIAHVAVDLLAGIWLAGWLLRD